ncbi:MULTISPECIES: hypothetical protein [Bacillus cereus group]|uniref:hypothetical protein n=1 Tax=Bacillus cereus group TaxID=86661 RepID=UPI000BEC53B1|nr:MULTISPECIES: hypothetical protein [Bacillus cereus group]PEA27525.1 hypothetical protein CON44_09750 [Bacillus cereus]MDR4163692.1 hypothetical protein [Bacillus paranthracis]PEW97322.1 hypothetical protein CN446_13220 [Bacillus cereus]PEX86934.1 hypothetical protein CN465_29085 [Bacillus cereus]PFK14351.1 hypothetical protein COJ05_26425 [Bacillus cereus]
MEKKYIEFILENEEHLKRIEELQKIWEEYVDFALNEVETTANGVSIADSKVHTAEYVESEFVKLIEDNYFFDDVCDCYGVIEEGYHMACFNNHPQMLIDDIKHERERRHTRKRHHKKSWERLKELGLE